MLPLTAKARPPVAAADSQGALLQAPTAKAQSKGAAPKPSQASDSKQAESEIV